MRPRGRHPSERSLGLHAGGDDAFARRWLVGHHVRKCPECRVAVDEFRRGAAALRAALPAPRADLAGLAHRVRVEAAQARAAPTPPGAWRWKTAAGATLGGLALAAALSLPRPGPDSPAAGEAAAPALALPHEGAETLVSAEGRLTVRSYHGGSATLTVTEYYAP